MSAPTGCNRAPSYGRNARPPAPPSLSMARQWPDGTVDAAVSVYQGDGAHLDATQARELAAALVTAPLTPWTASNECHQYGREQKTPAHPRFSSVVTWARYTSAVSAPRPLQQGILGHVALTATTWRCRAHFVLSANQNVVATTLTLFHRQSPRSDTRRTQ
jgi:hypothetical protein